MKVTARIQRWNLSFDDPQVRQRMERRSTRVSLGSDTPQADAERFESAAKQIFLFDPEVLRIASTILDVGRAHAMLHFDSDEAFVRGLLQTKESPWGPHLLPAICLTGLSGVGKTELIAAIRRALGPPIAFDAPRVRNLSAVSLWTVSVRDGASLNQLLGPLVGEGVPTDDPLAEGKPDSNQQKPPKVKGNPNLLKAVRKKSWLAVVAVLVVDEFQFVTQSANANAKATGLLLQLRSIGPRLVYCINYSLGHKLARRSSEDQQRLLAEPIIMRPLRRGTPEWLALLDELKTVCPEVFVFNTKAIEAEIHGFTYGVKRYVVTLIKWAYVVARSGRHNQGTVGLDELRAAFLSVEYSRTREDVTILFRQDVENKMIRADLWCPFHKEDQENVSAHDSADNGHSPARDARPGKGASSPSNVVPMTPAIEELARRVYGKLIDGTLTPEERSALDALGVTRPVARKAGKVVRFSRRPTSKQDLLDGAKALEELE